MNRATAKRPQISKIALGTFGEEVIAQFLVKDGFSILDRNWRVKEGEIDLVVERGREILAFVEVKTRTSLGYGHPLEAIDRRKAQRLHRLALAWLATHQRLGANYRIDCAAVLIDPAGHPQIDYRADI